MNIYFPYSIQISREGWQLFDQRELSEVGGATRPPFIVMARKMAEALDRKKLPGEKPPTGGEINLFALLNRAYRHIIRHYDREQNRQALQKAARGAGYPVGSSSFAAISGGFVRHYPPLPEPAPLPQEVDTDIFLTELFILRFNGENPALVPFKPLCDDTALAQAVPSRELARGLEAFLSREEPLAGTGVSLPELLWAPIKASPGSLAGQVEFIRSHWQAILPPDLAVELLTALDIVEEERRPSFGGAGQPQVLEFFKGGKLGRGDHEYPEYERFSSDADWMANVVMIAKMSYVWLDQLSKQYRRPVDRLDQIPDEELDRLARWGFTCLWLIGVWERSPASQKIKHMGGNTEAIASAYSLFDYVIAADLGGEPALADLKERCAARGIRLASDMVPNHTGIFSKWVVEHPDWFIQLDYPPYPAYSYTGENLSSSSDITVQIEDGYWDRRDAAVVFKHHDNRNGRSRYIYHGNDGTSTPWNDTAQLNYLLPEVREAVIQTILHVARQFPVIRFDAAMTLAKKHFQRLWYPQPGHGSGVPSRAEHGMSREAFDAVMPEEFWREVVDRVSVEAPGTLLLAEAFWLMEGYFVRTLGMHRVYNSAFMNMLKMEDNAKYRQTVKNVLEFDPEILKRFVNFMNNPDERTAVEQFGKEGKYFGACLLLITMPGLPMFGHGQVEGFHEKYGMEYRRAAWDEPVDQHLVHLHEKLMFPLVRRRHIFSGSENFVFYDFFAGSQVNEDVFAYSNSNQGERGLIVYHNRFASTAGWIRTSTAMGRKSPDGSTSLVQTTLGDALAINGEESVFYSFRDYGSGLEFLRPGRELCDQGLYLGLEAFQYYAFLDFREIRDDTGHWRELCGRLEGRGVPSLSEAMKQVRYGGLLNRYRTLCNLMATRWPAFTDTARPEAYREESFSLIRDEATALLALLAVEGLPLDPEYVAGLILRGGEAMGGILTASAKLGAQSEPLTELRALLAEPWALALFTTSLFLQATVTAGLLHSSSWFTDYGLDAATTQHMGTVPESAASLLDPGAAADLAGISLANGDFFLEATEEEIAARGEDLFRQPEIRQFLLVHTSGGKEWFNKERWELLLLWLSLSATVREAIVSGEEKRMMKSLTESYKLAKTLKSAAATWGYEVPSSQEV